MDLTAYIWKAKELLFEQRVEQLPGIVKVLLCRENINLFSGEQKNIYIPVEISSGPRIHYNIDMRNRNVILFFSLKWFSEEFFLGKSLDK